MATNFSTVEAIVHVPCDGVAAAAVEPPVVLHIQADSLHSGFITGSSYGYHRAVRVVKRKKERDEMRRL